MENIKERNKLVDAEVKRLKKIFNKMPPDTMEIVEGLIIQVARLRVMLNEMWVDISLNGDYGGFKQSKDLPDYERERPVAKLYNNRDTAYQRALGQLVSYLPKEEQSTVQNDLKGRSLL